MLLRLGDPPRLGVEARHADERRSDDLWISRVPRGSQHSRDVAERAFRVVSGKASVRSYATDAGLEIVRLPRLTGRHEVIRAVKPLVPFTLLEEMEELHRTRESCDGHVPEALAGLHSLVEERASAAKVPELPHEHTEVVVGARRLGRPDSQRDRDAALEVLEARPIAEVLFRNRDVDECMCADLVQAELFRHCEGLAAGPDRVMPSAGERVVARDLAEHMRLAR